MSLGLIVALLLVAQAPAGASGACGSSEARAFDFWIGEWEIAQKILRTDGGWLELPAKTSVSPALDGCALVEHWEGEVQFFWEGMQAPQAMRGLSVRAWDPESRRWRIDWMDTRSPRFGAPYTGVFVDGRGEFFRDDEATPGRQTGRITFSDITPRSVRWELSVPSRQGADWTTLWVMEMSRPGPP